MDIFEAITNQSTEGIAVSDLDGHYLFVNPAFCKMMAYSEKELLQKTVFDMKAPEQDHSTFERSKGCDEGLPVQVQLQRKDKTIFVAEVIGKKIEIDGQQRVLGTIRDITEQVNAEEKINTLSQAIEQSPATVVITDTKANIEYVSSSFESITGYRSAEVIGKNPRILKSGKTPDHIYNEMWEALNNNQPWQGELHNRKKNGEHYTEYANIAPVFNKAGEKSHYLAIKQDITERIKTENILLENEERFRSIFQSSVVAMILATDKDQGIISEWNSGAEKIFGYSAKQAVGQSITLIIPENLRAAHSKGFSQAINNEGLLHGGITHEIQGLRSNGQAFPMQLTLSSWKKGKQLYFCAVILDITKRKQAEELILHQAHYDTLTNLPNRFLSLDRLSHLINEAKRKNELIAVLFLDLDDFKKVNDTLGHETGDKLLVEAGQRLLSVVRAGDSVGRLGGDEFIILLTGINDVIDALPVVENLLSQFREAFKVDGRELILTASIGISIFPNDGSSASDLLRNADSAMYNSKEFGRNTYSYFTEAMNKKVARRLLIEEQMLGALDRGEFYILFQPQIEIRTNHIIGAEALLRWNNPVLGNITPDEFISISEQTGLIVALGEFVLSHSLSLTAHWHHINNISFRIAVNLSPRQFRDPNLVDFIKKAIDVSGVPAECLELEITEGVLMSGHAYIDNALTEINKLGVELSMDDFGTGYSSLSYLRNYPFDTLKIDRTFVNDISNDPADKELVNATIAMAHGLGLKVVAEGVETEEQLAYLKAQHCEYAQGFYFSEPVSDEKITMMLKNQK
jgi:diguanylate cyclase (GGDEF)-like protein/PAS domain S-box-containing protein